MVGDSPISKAALVCDLREMGLQAGDMVLFHSSLKSIGRVAPGPEAVIEAFLEVLGPEGTLVAPTLIPAFRGIRPLFDVEKSPSEMGLLTEVLRKWPGAMRSAHPTHSAAAVGRLAGAVTGGDRPAHGPNTPWGRDAVGFDSPWDRLREHNAWVLMIGVDFRKCTLLHHVQARYFDRNGGVTARTPWPEFDFGTMGDSLDAAGLVKHGKLGNAACLLARAGDIVAHSLELLETRPEAFLRSPSVRTWLTARSRIEKQGRPRASVFKVDVTPPAIAREAGRPLHLRGLLLDHPQGGQAALVVWDRLLFLAGDGNRIREAISSATGIPSARILLTTTHTHSDCWRAFRPVAAEFADWFDERVSEAAQAAMAELAPVRAGWTSVHAPGINRNRTVYLRDGTAYTERWALPFSWHVPWEQILRRGPADEELRLLVLERPDRSRLAVVANFSCHSSAAMLDGRVSDDFFGVAMEIVERTEGKGCMALCTPGSEGDQDPTALVELGGTRDMAYAETLGKRLAGYILSGTAGMEMNDLFPLGAGNVSTEVKVREDWKSAVKQRGGPELQAWAVAGRAPAEVSAIAVGDFAMVGIPAEIFTAPAQRIREHAPFSQTAVMALTNGCVGYVAEAEAFFSGSSIYGVYSSFSAMAEPGSDTTLCEAGIQALRQAKDMQL